VDRLAIGASIETCSERERRADMVERLWAVVEGSKEAAVALPNDDLLRAVDSGIVQVFAPGSRVGLREQGVLFTEVRIIKAAMMPMPPENFERLMYQVECPPRYPGSPPGRRWIGADYLEATAEEGEWKYALWDTQMQVCADSLDGSAKQ
jgi:hypothetical protein